jgi:hypothetical protein
MPIAVVVTRDDVGAPTTREIYARGDRYRIGDGNLQVLSADSRVLALYGSGNWLSAYVAGTVTVTSMGKDCSLAGEATADEVPADGPTDTEPTAADPTDAELTAADPTDAEPPAVEPTDTEPTAVSSAPASRPEAPPDRVPAVADGRPPARAADAEKDRGRPGWMQPVVFRPRKLAQNRPAEDQPVAQSRMRTVAFRPKTFTRGDAGEAASPAGESGPRPVVFRRRTYRAVLIETEPGSADAEPDADG